MASHWLPWMCHIIKAKNSASSGGFFLYELGPLLKEGKNENDRIASPESAPMYLKSICCESWSLPMKIIP